MHWLLFEIGRMCTGLDDQPRFDWIALLGAKYEYFFDALFQAVAWIYWADKVKLHGVVQYSVVESAASSMHGTVMSIHILFDLEVPYI